jgi:phenylacetate-CoA ligase
MEIPANSSIEDRSMPRAEAELTQPEKGENAERAPVRPVPRPEPNDAPRLNAFRRIESEFIRRAIFPVFDRRWHPDTERYLAELRALEFSPLDQVIERQWVKLKAMVDYAGASVPYYRETFREAGIAAGDIRSFEDYQRIPVLKKSTLQNRLNDLIASTRKAEEGIANASGGSTGKPVQFYQDGEYWNRSAASERFVEGWWGIQPGDRRASVWGTDRDVPEQSWRERLYGYIAQTRLCNAFRLQGGQMEEFAKMLAAWQPRHITGYASSLAVFARFVAERPEFVIRPRAVRTTADVLGDDRRGVIQQAFQCPVYNFYGSREINNLAAECPEHSGLHTNALTRYIEIVDDAGRPLAPGKPGRILLTDLTNFYMPFLRYEIEDVGSWSAKKCSCGRPLPLIDKLWGRSSDFIVTPEGKLIHSVFFTHLFYDMPEVSLFQFVQKSTADVRIYLVLRPGEAGYRSALLDERLRLALGPRVQFTVETVEKIDRPPSGKHRFVISSVAPPWGSGKLAEDRPVPVSNE